MRIAIHLAHPAHFHLFKKLIFHIINKTNNKILITYNDKDVLSELIKDSDLEDYSRKVWAMKNVNNAFSLKIQFIQKIIGVFFHYLIFRPNVVLGTPIIITLVGYILRYKSIVLQEDDFDIIEKTANLGYPFASFIISPSVCRTGKFDDKVIKYDGYHELAYLHPDLFVPDKKIVDKYIKSDNPYFIIRFAKLTAHHDVGIKGISNNLANEIISRLEKYGQVFISSERKLNSALDKHRISIDPKDVHHVMAFADMYIGDSQTMAAESGVLGVPFIRFNDFVGRISYLKELEENYSLGYGIRTNQTKLLMSKIDELLNMENRLDIFQKRRGAMLNDKINLVNFLSWIIDEYPNSFDILKKNPNYQDNFK